MQSLQEERKTSPQVWVNYLFPSSLPPRWYPSPYLYVVFNQRHIHRMAAASWIYSELYLCAGFSLPFSKFQLGTTHFSGIVNPSVHFWLTSGLLSILCPMRWHRWTFSRPFWVSLHCPVSLSPHFSAKFHFLNWRSLLKAWLSASWPFRLEGIF